MGIRLSHHLTSVNMDTLPISQADPAKFTAWDYKVPPIHLGLAQYTKETTAPSLYKSKYLEMRSLCSDHEAIFTDGSKQERKASAAVYTQSQTYYCRLPDWSTIFSAELKAISMAFEHISGSAQDKFVIFIDSLSSL